LRDMGDAIALTFVQTISITQADIFELLPDYPKAFYTVRKAALRMALIRALVKAAGIISRGNAKQLTANMTITQIFDMAMREAAESRQIELERKHNEKHKPIPLSLHTVAAKLGGSFKKKKAAGEETLLKGRGAWGKLGKLRMQDGNLSRLSANSCGSAVGAPVGSGGGAPKAVELGVASINKHSIEDEVRALHTRVGVQQQAMSANHAKMIERLAILEASMTSFVATMTTKLDTSAKPIVKQKRLQRNGGSALGRARRGADSPAAGTSDSGVDSVNGNGAPGNTAVCAPVSAADVALAEERRELREEASNGNLPTHSSPFEA